MMGIFKKAGTTPKKHLAEFKFDEEYNLGDTITVELFQRLLSLLMHHWYIKSGVKRFSRALLSVTDSVV